MENSESVSASLSTFSLAAVTRSAVARMAPQRSRSDIILMNLCGRGDKDIFTVADALGFEM